jgi:hypothetical protein
MQEGRMNNDPGTAAELRIAEEIVGVLPAGSVARVVTSERDAICYRVRSASMRLHTVRFKRASLRKLAADTDRDVKVDYIKRDLLRAAGARLEYHFPHAVRIAPLRHADHPPRHAASV